MAVTKEDVIEFISTMSVLELSELIKELCSIHWRALHLVRASS